ncbi:MAG: hypothetical protein BWY68_00354 [bacterium ADurb.Bin400]|nr:MAG: hypothetical protein BWY68_00354 [bacterium ADurb.Bin400]
MGRNKKAKTIAIRSFTAALGLAFGILITAQWRSVPARVTNPIAPYASLKETRDELYDEQNRLKSEIKNLQQAIEKAQKDNENVGLTKDELKELDYRKAQAGLTRMSGPGIVIVYDDSTTAAISEESIVHAADLRDTINLLWGSGAEAIAINGQRVVVNSAIDCIVNTILVNNTRISNPFRIEAVGDQDLMYEKIQNPTILKDVHQRKNSQGLYFEVSKRQNITVPVFDGSYEVKTLAGS